MSRNKTPRTQPPGQPRHYGARVLDDPRHDPYQATLKLRDGTRCTTCGATYAHGRWTWGSGTAASPVEHPIICPACRRIAERLPAGTLTLDGPYTESHGDELVRLAQSRAELERKEHPMHRIMSVDRHADRIEIATTDIHLPRLIGEAIERAHDGKLTTTFSPDEYAVRVHWRR